MAGNSEGSPNKPFPDDGQITVVGGIRNEALATKADAEGERVPASHDKEGRALVRVSAADISMGGTVTEYTVDDAAPANPSGPTMVMERDDALATLTEVDGDWTNPRSNSRGALWVAIDPGTAAGDLAKAEDAASASGDTGVMVLGIRRDTPSVLTSLSGDYSGIAVSENGAVKVELDYRFGGESDRNLSAVRVSGSGISTSAAAGIIAQAHGRNNPTTLVGAEDQVVQLAATRRGALFVELNNLSNAATNERSLVKTPGSEGMTAATPGVMGISVHQNLPNNTVDGSTATSGLFPLKSNANGALWIAPDVSQIFRAKDNQASAQTNKSIQSAPGANLSIYVTDIIVSNGATAGTIRLVEDPAGTPVDLTPDLYLPINGGGPIHLESPIKLTANKALGYTSVTVTTHSVMCLGRIAA